MMIESIVILTQWMQISTEYALSSWIASPTKKESALVTRKQSGSYICIIIKRKYYGETSACMHALSICLGITSDVLLPLHDCSKFHSGKCTTCVFIITPAYAV